MAVSHGIMVLEWRSDTMRNSIADNIVSIRKKYRLSQEQFAEKVNVSRQAVSNWERGVAVPDVTILDKIATIFETDLTSLVSGTTESEYTNTGSNENLKMKPFFMIISVIMAIVHLILGICGFVNFVAVISLPLMCAFILSIIYLTFNQMIKSNNYKMLAGFDSQKDSIKATRLQMYWGALLSGLTAILFEILFVLIYFAPQDKQMDYTTIMMLTYFSIEFLCFIVINLKIKSRK